LSSRLSQAKLRLLSLEENMNKHTPGPWATYVNTNNDVTIRKMFPDGQECCEIASCKSGFTNARLIAAAPELLEALQFVMSAHGEQLSTAFAMAQDAITKATGETQ
jgi:hypothetical protein